MTRGYLERPDCRVYYEVAGAGPMLVFAHGLGGNHLSWWQQVPHFRDRYTCVTFAHRGFAPSSPLADGPDPADYAGDLAALIDHLGAGEVRIVAQSMGGWSALEYALANPERVRALVLASTAGAITRAPSLFGDPAQMPGWERTAAAAAAAMQANNIHVAAGERMAREQPAAHFLYQEIDALSGIDKLKLRQRLGDRSRPSGRGAAHARRSDAVADRRGGCRLSAVPLRHPGAHDAEGRGRAGRRTPATRSISSGRPSSIGSSTRSWRATHRRWTRAAR